MVVADRFRLSRDVRLDVGETMLISAWFFFPFLLKERVRVVDVVKEEEG